MSTEPDTRPPVSSAELSKWVKSIVGDERAFRESVIRQLAEISTRLAWMEKTMADHVADDRGKFASVEQRIEDSDDKADDSRGKLNYILGGAAMGAFVLATAIAVARLFA